MSCSEKAVMCAISRVQPRGAACGILCLGFVRAGFVVAFSCKGRSVCPSCNGRAFLAMGPVPAGLPKC